jgi:hypothetical protein
MYLTIFLGKGTRISGDLYPPDILKAPETSTPTYKLRGLKLLKPIGTKKSSSKCQICTIVKLFPLPPFQRLRPRKVNGCRSPFTVHCSSKQLVNLTCEYQIAKRRWSVFFLWHIIGIKVNGCHRLSISILHKQQHPPSRSLFSPAPLQ